MTGYVIAGLVIVGLVAVYLLLVRITEEGGRSDRDPAAITDQILAEVDVFRGDPSADDSKWDGQIRLAPPTQEGAAWDKRGLEKR